MQSALPLRDDSKLWIMNGLPNVGEPPLMERLPVCERPLHAWQLLSLRFCHRTDEAMREVFDALYASLHVRVGNKGAFHLYTETLGYQ